MSEAIKQGRHGMMEAIPLNQKQDVKLPKYPNFPGAIPMANVIKFEPKFRNAILENAARWIIVENLDVGTKMREQFPNYPFNFITLDGELLTYFFHPNSNKDVLMVIG